LSTKLTIIRISDTQFAKGGNPIFASRLVKIAILAKGTATFTPRKGYMSRVLKERYIYPPNKINRQGLMIPWAKPRIQPPYNPDWLRHINPNTPKLICATELRATNPFRSYCCTMAKEETKRVISPRASATAIK